MRELTQESENVDTIYRPFCYWGWVDSITPEEAVRQVRLIYDAGLGGFVMHARGGLTIPYAGRQMDGQRSRYA